MLKAGGAINWGVDSKWISTCLSEIDVKIRYFSFLYAGIGNGVHLMVEGEREHISSFLNLGVFEIWYPIITRRASSHIGRNMLALDGGMDVKISGLGDMAIYGLTFRFGVQIFILSIETTFYIPLYSSFQDEDVSLPSLFFGISPAFIFAW